MTATAEEKTLQTGGSLLLFLLLGSGKVSLLLEFDSLLLLKEHKWKKGSFDFHS